MKVVLVTEYQGSKPFSDELAYNLLKKGIDVELFDMFEMFTLKFANSNVIHYHITNSFIRKICKIRLLGAVIRFIFYKWYFIVKPFKYDHVSIHYALPLYRFFICTFKRHVRSVSICIWGSDFYRASDKKRDTMNSLFDHCDSIIIGNITMAEEFSNYYDKKYKDKILPVGFGIGKLDIIKDYKAVLLKDHIRCELEIPKDKLIITIGYNGIRQQQHLLVLEHFEKIRSALKDNLFILIPFGYGGDVEYRQAIENKLKKLKIGFIIFDSFISDQDIAKLRLATDIVINAQISDASSASIQEHLYAENVLLTGEWLPYTYFTHKGVRLWSFGYDNFFEKLVHVLENFESFQKEVQINSEIIYNLSSWGARIDQWIDAFEFNCIDEF